MIQLNYSLGNSEFWEGSIWHVGDLNFLFPEKYDLFSIFDSPEIERVRRATVPFLQGKK